MMDWLDENKVMIKLTNVEKTYKMGEETIHALNDITLEIQKSEFVSIIGPSGSGKSTLMHVIGGLDRIDNGEIIVDDLNLLKINDKSLASFRNKKIGFVFQSFNLQPTLTAMENVMLPLIFAGMKGSERKRKAQEALEKVGLADRLYHRPTEMSGGQRQRVSIARALVNNPSIILADEPTGNLDSKTGANIIEMLDQLNSQNGITIVVVTHDAGIAQAADRVITIKDGRILDDKKGSRGRESQFISKDKVK